MTKRTSESTPAGPDNTVNPLAHRPGHREDWRGLIADAACPACQPLFFIYGSQIVDEPLGPFEARVLESRKRVEAMKAKKRAAS